MENNNDAKRGYKLNWALNQVPNDTGSITYMLVIAKHAHAQMCLNTHVFTYTYKFDLTKLI